MGAFLRLLALAAALALSATLVPSARAAAAAPVSAHAMLFSYHHSVAFKERVFAEAKALGANYVRVDVEMDQVFKDPSRPDWHGLDQVTFLSRAYGVPVLGILLRPPNHISTCPTRPDAWRCAIGDTEEFGRLAGAIAAHAPAIGHWEIINEPDGLWAFEGGPENYGHALRAAGRHIRLRAPGAQVVLGGLMDPANDDWVGRALHAAGSPASFDIANVHLRGYAGDMRRQFTRSRELLRARGFHGEIWVTEHGYPADRAFQRDPAFTSGEAGQAAYLSKSVLALAQAGANQVFVTLRDNDTDFEQFRTEGIARIEEDGSAARRKPAFHAVRRLVDNWARISRWDGFRQDQEGLARIQELRAEAARLRWREESKLGRSSSAAARRAERRTGRKVSCRRGKRRPRRVAASRLATRTCLLRAAAEQHRRRFRTHLLRGDVAQRAATRHRRSAKRWQAMVRFAVG